MEVCEKFYREWKIKGKVSRIAKVLAVIVVFELLVGSVCVAEPAYSGRAGQAKKFIEGAEGLRKMTATAIPIKDLFVHEDSSLSELNSMNVKRKLRTAEAVMETETAGAKELTEETVVVPAETLPQMSEETMSQIPEEIVPSVPDAPAGSDLPSGALEEENTVIPATVDGFFVDEYGMISGIADPSVAEDGCLILPSEGCSGIRRGAFAGAPAGICEVFIPANITLIEEGAMSDLSDAEWFEAEPGSYYSEDGVLFSEEGTCLLAFPSARTGFYKVPSGVSRFAHDAFAGARIETVDVTKCTLTDMGNLPENVAVLDTPGRIVVY